ncbi:MAG TPA: hypothetical protein VMV73_00480 [Candidatus Dormibacteraeota bacterium]|nr:hypothetical protein [Candidatus Dormibacteraeota bacterium]
MLVLSEDAERQLREQLDAALAQVDVAFNRARSALHADLGELEARTRPPAEPPPLAAAEIPPQPEREKDDGGSRVSFDEEEPASVVAFDELPTWEEST